MHVSCPASANRSRSFRDASVPAGLTVSGSGKRHKPIVLQSGLAYAARLGSAGELSRR